MSPSTYHIAIYPYVCLSESQLPYGLHLDGSPVSPALLIDALISV